MPHNPVSTFPGEGQCGWKVPGMEYSGLASLLADQPSGARLFARVGYPAELQTAMDDPVVDGHSVEKMIR